MSNKLVLFLSFDTIRSFSLSDLTKKVFIVH